MTPTGFQRSTEASAGLESQSIAFLRTPEVPRLYSGVAMRSASASRDRAPQLRDRLGIAGCFHVTVVERDRGEVELPDLDPVPARARRRPQERPVVRALPQAAGDPEDSAGHSGGSP